MKSMIAAVGVAFGFWFLMFAPPVAGLTNFWVTMIVACGVLTTIVLGVEGTRFFRARFHFKTTHLWIGVGSAVVFYLVFLAGEFFSRKFLPGSSAQVASIYARKGATDPALIALALFFWIGPAEEIFWRGFVQERLMNRFGARSGALWGVALYTAVHIPSMNPMLCLAALLCGLFWGGLYYRFRSLWPGIISHALWDLVIFVILPVAE